MDYERGTGEKRSYAQKKKLVSFRGGSKCKKGEIRKTYSCSSGKSKKEKQERKLVKILKSSDKGENPGREVERKERTKPNLDLDRKRSKKGMGRISLGKKRKRSLFRKALLQKSRDFKKSPGFGVF